MDNKAIELLEQINSMCYVNGETGEDKYDKPWERVSDLICEALPEVRQLQERVDELEKLIYAACESGSRQAMLDILEYENVEGVQKFDRS